MRVWLAGELAIYNQLGTKINLEKVRAIEDHLETIIGIKKLFDSATVAEKIPLN